MTMPDRNNLREGGGGCLLTQDFGGPQSIIIARQGRTAHVMVARVRLKAFHITRDQKPRTRRVYNVQSLPLMTYFHQLGFTS